MPFTGDELVLSCAVKDIIVGIGASCVNFHCLGQLAVLVVGVGILLPLDVGNARDVSAQRAIVQVFDREYTSFFNLCSSFSISFIVLSVC